MEILTKEVILSTLNENKSKIKSFGVKSLVLFGSYARDEQQQKSDIDFIVEFNENRGGFDDYTSLLHFLEDTFKAKIDLGKKSLIREELKDEILKGVQYAAKI